MPGEPRWEDADAPAATCPDRADSLSGDDADPAMVAEVAWYGGGTRDAYEALLRALFAPEAEAR